MLKAIFAGTGLALLLLVAAGTVMAQQGDPAKGRTLWSQNLCRNCHGENGEGRFAFPLAGTQRTVQEVINQVRNPRSQMPAFDANHISDQDLTDIHAFLRSLQPPASFAPVPFTSQPGDDPGKVLFNQKRCVACHGDGAGLVKNRFADQNREVTREAVIKQLRTPLQRMPMFNATQVSDEQAGQIAAYLASLAPPPGVSFKLGFQTLASLIPAIVGNPKENEHFAANGDSQQMTTGGLMVWRKADNWTAFTDGERTWINGPLGLQERGNSERFDWERS